MDDYQNGEGGRTDEKKENIVNIIVISLHGDRSLL